MGFSLSSPRLSIRDVYTAIFFVRLSIKDHIKWFFRLDVVLVRLLPYVKARIVIGRRGDECSEIIDTFGCFDTTRRCDRQKDGH